MKHTVNIEIYDDALNEETWCRHVVKSRYIRMKKLKEKEKNDETKETQEEELRHTFLHTSMLIHTNMSHTQL